MQLEFENFVGRLVCVCLNCEILGSELRLASVDVITLYGKKFKKGTKFFFCLKITSNGVK